MFVVSLLNNSYCITAVAYKINYREKIMANDSWRTPPEVFNRLHAEFNFMADMAASHENSLLPLHFTEKQDSLSFDWASEPCLQSFKTRYVWLNCPYSNPMPWVKHALKAQTDGLGVVMLLNADTSVGWFAEALKGVSEIRNIVGDEKQTGYSSGRLAFINDEGNPISGNNKPQFILVFNPFKIGDQVTTYVNRNSFYTGE